MHTVLFSAEAGPTLPTQSKVGGTPYFPIGFASDPPKHPYMRGFRSTPWPKHAKNGRELQLLIQINFAEMPNLPPFPRAGILQIFVDDGAWHELGRSLRTYYHSDVADDAYDFSEVSTAHFRVPESALHFTKIREDTIQENEIGVGNKIGGYYLSRTGDYEVRADFGEWPGSQLLVQFDDSGALSWGDCASGQFFIKTADLSKPSFSDLLFHHFRR